MSATWNRAQELGQPLTLIVIGVSKSGSRCSSSVGSVSAALLGLDERQLAELDAGAGHRAAAERRRAHRAGRAPRARRRAPRRRSAGTSSTTSPAAAVRRDPARRRSRSASSASLAQRRAATCGRTSVVAPTANSAVVLRARRRCGRGAAGDAAAARAVGQRAVQVLRLEHLAELLRAPVGHQELQPGVVARAAGSRSRGRSTPTPAQTSLHLVRADEHAEPLGEHRVGRQAAADPQVEAGRRRRRRRTPTNATSLISWLVQCAAQPEIDGLELARQVGERRVAEVASSTVSRSAGVASSTASAATPSSGQPSMTRGVSPQASVVDRPTASSVSQIAGTSSIRIQCSWMFCRSVMSAMSRPYSVEMSATTRSCSLVERAAVDADPHHEVLVVELLGLERSRSCRRGCRGGAGCTARTSGTGRAGRPGRCRRSRCAGRCR